MERELARRAWYFLLEFRIILDYFVYLVLGEQQHCGSTKSTVMNIISIGLVIVIMFLGSPYKLEGIWTIVTNTCSCLMS